MGSEALMVFLLKIGNTHGNGCEDFSQCQASKNAAEVTAESKWRLGWNLANPLTQLGIPELKDQTTCGKQGWFLMLAYESISVAAVHKLSLFIAMCKSSTLLSVTALESRLNV